MSSVPAIEGILRKAMADDTQASLDGFLIDAVAESAMRPAGLLVGVSPITASAAATSLEKIVADINALIAPMEAAGAGGNIVLLMNPAQARKIGMAMTTTGDFAFGSPDRGGGQVRRQAGSSQSTTIAGRPGDCGRCRLVRHRDRRPAAVCRVQRGDHAHGGHDAAGAGTGAAGHRLSLPRRCARCSRPTRSASACRSS